MIIQAGNPGWIPSSDLLGSVCVHCIQTYTPGHTDILIKINRVEVVVQCSKTLARRTKVQIPKTNNNNKKNLKAE